MGWSAWAGPKFEIKVPGATPTPLRRRTLKIAHLGYNVNAWGGTLVFISLGVSTVKLVTVLTGVFRGTSASIHLRITADKENHNE